MNKTEQVIIDIMKALYHINEAQEKKLIDSFIKTREDEKEKIASELYSFYKKTHNNLKDFMNNINKINIEIDEYKEKLSAENILDQL